MIHSADGFRRGKRYADRTSGRESYSRTLILRSGFDGITRCGRSGRWRTRPWGSFRRSSRHSMRERVGHRLRRRCCCGRCCCRPSTRFARSVSSWIGLSLTCCSDGSWGSGSMTRCGTIRPSRRTATGSWTARLRRSSWRRFWLNPPCSGHRGPDRANHGPHEDNDLRLHRQGAQRKRRAHASRVADGIR